MIDVYSFHSLAGLKHMKLRLCSGLMTALLLALTACDSEERFVSENQLILSLPHAMGARSLPEGVVMEGRGEIPQLERKIPLRIEGETASAHLSGLAPGSYTIRLVFEATNTGFGRFILAEAVREVEIVDGSNMLSFLKADYNYPDTDSDKYTNLIEIEHGTDPASAVDMPETARVFVTSVSGAGDLSSWRDAGGKTGIAAGDAICQARADAAGLQGSFVAWLSDENHDAYCRVHGLGGKKNENCGRGILPAFAGPWVRTDGFPFSPGIDEVVNQGVVYSPVSFNEFGENRSFGAPTIWTGTSASGEVSVHPEDSLNCANWMSADPARKGRSGIMNSGAYTWTERFRDGCETESRLLCFEFPGGTPLPLFKKEGKVVFVTSVSGSGDLAGWPEAGGFTGIAAGDAICRNRAAAGGLPNSQSYKAWLSGSTTDAIDRLVSDGPWVRPDGVIVAENKSDLVDNNGIFSSISVDENRAYFTEYVVHTDDDAWTGTDSQGRGTGVHCNDWTSGNQQDRGGAGTATLGLIYWASRLVGVDDPKSFYELDCSIPLRLFCFED